MLRKLSSSCVIHLAAFAAVLVLPLGARGQAAAPGILNAAQAGKLIPVSVYFAGQTATTQPRNSAGVRFADGQLTLAVLVNNSGYSSGVAQKYQGYLLTGIPLDFGGHPLPAGAYGMGVVKGQLYLMDLGDHGLFHTAATHDAAMHRPVPLQIVAGAANGTYRLCFGRECIEFEPAR
jgi:hypothetical protein